jgi:hypothetical protein
MRIIEREYYAISEKSPFNISYNTSVLLLQGKDNYYITAPKYS